MDFCSKGRVRPLCSSQHWWHWRKCRGTTRFSRIPPLGTTGIDTTRSNRKPSEILSQQSVGEMIDWLCLPLSHTAIKKKNKKKTPSSIIQSPFYINAYKLTYWQLVPKASPLNSTKECDTTCSALISTDLDVGGKPGTKCWSHSPACTQWHTQGKTCLWIRTSIEIPDHSLGSK